MRYADGDNFSIDLDGGVVVCVVWKRPDLDSQVGADLATQIARHLQELTKTSGVRGAIFDLRRAPPVAGPRTREAFGDILLAWEKAEKPISILVGEDARQRLQLGRIVTDQLARFAFVATTREDAKTFVETGEMPVSSIERTTSAGRTSRSSQMVERPSTMRAGELRTKLGFK